MFHHRIIRLGLVTGFVFLLSFSTATAQEHLDEEAIAAIRKHGLEQSQVMETLSWITDIHGPRLTGSPNLDKASEWALEQFAAWGLTNPHFEEWGPFGNGWTLLNFNLRVTGDTPFPVHAYPKAWSPGTNGPVEAEVVLFDPETEEDFARFEGKLAGKFVMIQDPREVEEPFEAPAQRRDTENLLGLANYAPSTARGGQRGGRNANPNSERFRQFRLQAQRLQFVQNEKPLAIFDRGSKGDYGTIFTSSASVASAPDTPRNQRPRSWDPKDAEVIPQLTLAVEHYNRISRMLEKGLPVTMSLNLEVAFKTDDPMERNVIAEIPGTDPDIGDEVVMLGAHYDSWHAGTGATDNGAGSAVMMEVMRILQEVFEETGKKPRRTIRVALWTGEEQGLIGSRAYVGQHFAETAGRGQPPTALKPEHEKFSAYYNMDNGTGKLRGVYLQGNEAVAPIFRAWLQPFADLGASTLSLSNTGGTDHLAFDAVGLPGFQFIQDQIAYSSRTHHSNMDVYDHAIEDDLKQAATIIASFVYHTAQRDEKLPRKVSPVTIEGTSR
ncbi:MAG: M28 family peptidase [Rhodothermales bacterium]